MLADPSIRNGASMRSWRRAAIKVDVAQCPCGTAPKQRWPRRLQPYRRAILVLRAVSSMKTRRRRSHCGCSRRQSWRAAATSGRSCSAACVVFFRAQSEAPQLVPEGVDPNRYAQLRLAAFLELDQADIRLAADLAVNRAAVGRQLRASVASDLLGPPVPVTRILPYQPRHRPPADPKASADFHRPGSRLASLDDPTPQILAQRSHGFASMDRHRITKTAMCLSKSKTL